MTVGIMIGVLLFAVLLALIFGTLFFVRIAFFRYLSVKEKKRRSVWARIEDKSRELSEKDLYEKARPWFNEIREGREYIASCKKEIFTLTSFDGLELKARFLPTDNARAIVILVHGFRSNPVHDFSCVVRTFHELGFSCLLPDQRATGESEGKYICYGRKEKYDIRDWAKLLQEKYPSVPVILDGVSMGAATVLMASGLELSDNVKGIIADCGYTSAVEMFEKYLKVDFKMPKFPYFYTAALVSKFFLGFSFKGETTQEALEKNKLPVFFAHGTADSLVPYEMTQRNYETALKYCDTQLFSVEGAEHGLSFLVDKSGYVKRLEPFIDKCIKSS